MKKTSSFCNRGDCVEVEMTMNRKVSSFSLGLNCVEVTEAEEVVLVSDTKAPGGEILFYPETWDELIERIKAGEFDQP